MSLSVILLAGGTGSRMDSATPKQYLPLCGKPIFQYSLDVFLSLPEVSEIIVVAAQEYHFLFPQNVKFALPGKRRQDSVYNGLQYASSDFICVHDAARPFISQKLMQELFQEGYIHKAAALAIPLKFTVKQAHAHFVQSTPDRSTLFEIQTPQILSADLLRKGFEHALKHNLTVTDDVSLAELLGHPVKLVPGHWRNIKITTPEDLLLAPHLLHG